MGMYDWAPTMSRCDTEETYIIELCNRVLDASALRQHCFRFLVGDPGKRGICRKLPIDAYYPALRLAIEYRETATQ